MTTNQKFNHAEAFCWMEYFGKANNGRGTISVRIYNSRDGVTPFILRCEQFEMDLQHVHWQGDIRNVEYLPKKGDLIWRDITKQDVEKMSKRVLEQRREELASYEAMSEEAFQEMVNSKEICFDVRVYLRELVAKGLGGIMEFFQGDIDRRSPFLEVVQEDWTIDMKKQVYPNYQP